ncbi:hypothetical protein [Dongia deserti]|uniref:hypothetical protein n=1 Tax=Dongia deserti TaxID=2268030 RepID=UPI000E654730|nr:hypothetical protein [Dongia deserti]
MSGSTVWFIILALAAAGIAVLAIMYRRNRLAVRSRRAGLFTPAYDLFSAYRVTQHGIDYPVLTGEYRGRSFHIDAIVDTLTFRKLPVLWLRVSLLASLPGTATLDILVRSQNAEFYSPANDLPHALAPLPGWPSDALVRTDDPQRAPDLSVVDRHMSVFARPATKELLVTAKGTRVVHMLDQARRAEYLVLRQAEFEHASVDRETLRDLMDRTIALYENLAASRKPA